MSRAALPQLEGRLSGLLFPIRIQILRARSRKMLARAFVTVEPSSVSRNSIPRLGVLSKVSVNFNTLPFFSLCLIQSSFVQNLIFGCLDRSSFTSMGGFSEKVGNVDDSIDVARVTSG